MSTELLERPATEIAEYSITAAALADLRARLKDVAYDVTTAKGLDIATKDRAEVRGIRVALEKKRVELKAPALERSRLIDAEAKALTAELVALEKPIDDQIKAEERRKESDKAARELAEREAAAVVQIAIDHMRHLPLSANGLPSGAIHDLCRTLASAEITLEQFGDRAGEAAQAKGQAIKVLAEMVSMAQGVESEAARLIEERAEMARQRTEQDAREKAERERVAAEQAEQAAKLATERKVFEQEQATARAEAKVREDADRARRDESDRIARESRAVEDARISRERAELEAAQHAVREADEAKSAVARKVEQDKFDKAAANERKRLDKIAADERAEAERLAAERAAKAQAEYEALMKSAEDLKRLHDAAPAMLAALQNLENDDNHIPESVWALVCAAIELATGETV